jgi:hypothetical protein
VLECDLEATMQNAVRAHDGARRQRPAVLAAWRSGSFILRRAPGGWARAA